MSTGLPPYLRRVRDRLRTAINHLDTLERLEISHAWGRSNPERMEKAIENIEQCVILAADTIGIKPKDAQFYRDIITRLQEENQRLSETNARLLEANPNARSLIVNHTAAGK